jgi:hypothetical protein
MLANIGMCDENLTSYNATMPIAYYFYKGGTVKDQESKKEARKFLKNIWHLLNKVKVK